MKGFRNILFIVLLVTITNSLFAFKWKGEIKRDNTPTIRATANCEPPRTSTDLAVNNVRTRIHTGGDMWWDLNGKPLYEIPVGGGAHALYAGSIWVGGLDANGQLKLAAQKFRQTGIDFWPGPLIKDGPERGSVSDQICREYDRHYSISKVSVTEFRQWRACVEDPNCDELEEYPDYSIPDEILEWPGNGPVGGYDEILAPFKDVNKDGYYKPSDGDFPYYIFSDIDPDKLCERPRDRDYVLYGDYTLWWVYNDRGNIHTETNGSPIGMEFKAQAFAFATNDDLNNMTFYNYKITNRSTYTLYNTYFGVWTDADLGNPKDDYVGCDVMRGLGYSYNGDDNDETASGHIGYGLQPPAVGIDFFEGPYQDPIGIDKSTSYKYINGVKTLDCTLGDILNGNINGLNFGDGIADNERWGMRRFLYFNNYPDGNENTRDPKTALQHYNYITGKWLDNTELCYGGTGHSSGGADVNTPTDFMFPGSPTTDKCGWGQGGIVMGDWSEERPGAGMPKNPAGDRRFVQSAGPFTLRPGAVNDITVGAVYARASSGGAWASVVALQRADDKAQVLFENCFRVLNGPDAPELKIIEMDKKLIFHISNPSTSNNYLEKYAEKDPALICDGALNPCDTAYRFQGYQIFQFKDRNVDITDRYDGDLVKQIFQCDIKDGVKKLVNYNWSDDKGANDPVIEVQGLDEGIVHTFVVEKDLFSDGDLVNNKEYYYSAIAYGYNVTQPYNQAIQQSFDGQKRPYIAGRNNIKKYKAVPRKNLADGTIQQANYGSGIEITMVEGYGNGNNLIELSKKSIDKIMQGSPWNTHNERIYESGKGPINVKIIDPLNVPEDTYVLKFDTLFADANLAGHIGANTQSMYNKNTYIPFTYYIYNTKGDTIYSDVNIRYGFKTEQIFTNWGFSITLDIDNFALAGGSNSHQNGFLEASITFDDPEKQWLYFIPDSEGASFMNWIRGGSYKNKAGELENAVNTAYDDITIDDAGSSVFADPDNIFGKILGGTWAPFILASPYKYGLAPYRGVSSGSYLNNIKPFFSEPLSSVNIVITSDKSKWTRACVVEMCENVWTTDDKGRPVEKKPIENLNSKGAALKLALRKDPSVDKEGRSLNDGTHGLGWFPGYAIDIRTGERLNMAFGEDSWLTSENGADMIWNPSYSISFKGEPMLGGKHAIYVFGNNLSKLSSTNAPAYDSCKFLHQALLKYESTKSTQDLTRAWQSAMWCAIPMHNPTYDLLATDVTIKLRVATPYSIGFNDIAVSNPQNNNKPMFKFSTENLKTIYNVKESAKSALDLINIVPNPYYGTSSYERDQLDTYVRITNLPRRCDITIYNSSGTLVRTFKKDNPDTYLEWDMKNSSNIAISSGVYIIHVKAYDAYNDDKSKTVVGERVLKWFGALRPVDLNNF